MGAKEYSVNIVGLKNTVHHFDFEVGNDFFEYYGKGLVSEGSLKSEVVLDKHETFIEATFHIRGSVRLICDRSLDPFDQPIALKRKLVFKYGDVEQELSDEIIVIHRDRERLDLGQYMYEFVALEIPIKKLHPRFKEEEENEEGNPEGKIIYSSKASSGESDDRENIDPRWDILKKLK